EPGVRIDEYRAPPTTGPHARGGQHRQRGRVVRLDDLRDVRRLLLVAVLRQEQPDARTDRDDEHLRARVLLPAAGRGDPRAARRPARTQVRHARHDHADGGRFAAHRRAADLLGGRLARPDPAAARAHRPGALARRRGLQRQRVPRRDRPAEPPRALLELLLHLHRHGAAGRVAARPAAHDHAQPARARDVRLAHRVRRRRRAGHRGALPAPDARRDRAVRGERREGEGHQEPAAPDAHALPALGAAALRLHAALDALLLHVLQRADPVRGAVPRRRGQRRVPRAVHRHGGVHPRPVPLRRAGRQIRAQATDAGVVGGVRAAHGAPEPADHRTSTTDQPDHRVLGGPRALLGVLLDRARDHERDLPDRAPRPGHRCLVQPHGRDLRRHRAAADRGPVRRGPARPLLLVRLRRRAGRVPDHPDAARDQGPRADV
ncbi:MAG: L-Proline/Glycine betaine transporter ProP, partial [uncultured Actinomycetospora sp.]